MTQSKHRPSCPDRVNILLVGGGGREHALAWKMAQSPRLGTLWLTNPENPALAELGQPCPAEIDYHDIWRIQEWCDRENVQLVVIGPEAPLADGLADALHDPPNRYVFGPTKAGAQIESDKAWAKQLMRSSAIPTAEARIFNSHEQALSYLESREEPPVVKASGLAAGKGVIVPDSVEEAMEALDRIMIRREFGEAGNQVIVEEKLTGQEVSVLALVDGRTIYVLEPAQDHKRLNEGDTGPNTGGMGAYCPTPVLDEATLATIEREILVPTIDALRREEIEYRGVLYAGIILTPGGPKVLEFNCRFGDPECQPLMARMKCDLIDVLWSTAVGRLDEVEIDWDERTACCVVMASGGYPGSYPTGVPITGINEAESLGDITVFHAGTRLDKANQLVTGGGRVLGVTALGETMTEAQSLANKTCEAIHFDGAYFRKDIGHAVLSENVK